MKSLKVLDRLCGTGKSTYILEEMERWKDEDCFDQFVYISPLLSEVGGEENVETGKYKNGRVQRDHPKLRFRYPVPKGGCKGDHIRELLLEGRNISATHNLFLSLEDADIELFRDKKNVLVIDEAVAAFEEFKGVSRDGVSLLINSGNLLVEGDNRLRWNHAKFPINTDMDCPAFGGKKFEYLDLVKLCDKGVVHLVQNRVVVWEFPISVLDAFDEVYVLTYLFEGSFMWSWCQLNDIPVEYIDPVLYKSNEEMKAFVREHVTVADAPPLKVLDRYSYSYTWWDKCKSKSVFNSINSALGSYIKNYLKGYSYEDYLFTYPKFLKEGNKLKGRGYTKADWLAVQTRATNDYAHKKVVFYLYDRHPNTTLYNFSSSKDCKINTAYFSVSELIQFLWRGCVRKGEPMTVVIASKRMRGLFFDWLDGRGDFSE